MLLQALLVTAAGTEALTNGCLSLKNAQEEQALDIALQTRQWHATQLLVAARESALLQWCHPTMSGQVLYELYHAAPATFTISRLPCIAVFVTMEQHHLA